MILNFNIYNADTLAIAILSKNIHDTLNIFYTDNLKGTMGS